LAIEAGRVWIGFVLCCNHVVTGFKEYAIVSIEPEHFSDFTRAFFLVFSREQLGEIGFDDAFAVCVVDQRRVNAKSDPSCQKKRSNAKRWRWADQEMGFIPLPRK
jgi:hypothetical protein